MEVLSMVLPLPTTRVGGTALAVTRLGIGTAPLGGLYAPVSRADAIATIHAALDSGISFFDTAPHYGAGQSEEQLGAALTGVPRERYVLATKVGRSVTADGRSVKEFTRDAVLRGIEDSLARLGVDRIDILHIHEPDTEYRQALDEVYPVLAELRAAGVIKAIGVGQNQWEMPADFVRDAAIDCLLLAGRYTLLEQGALPVLLSLCQERNVSVFLGGVFNSGILVTGAQPGAKYNYFDAPAPVMDRVRQIETICARHGTPLAHAAVQFPAAHPAVSSLVIGVRSVAEVAALHEAWQANIPAQLWADLRDAGLTPATT
jgi:D-threo-aldose 1-dehydrogenase